MKADLYPFETNSTGSEPLGEEKTGTKNIVCIKQLPNPTGDQVAPKTDFPYIQVESSLLHLLNCARPDTAHAVGVLYSRVVLKRVLKRH
jgi:hypothetical protein